MPSACQLSGLRFASEIHCGGYQGHLLKTQHYDFWSCRVGACPPHAPDLPVCALLQEGENAFTACCRHVFWLLVALTRNSEGIPSPVSVLPILKPTQFHTQVNLVFCKIYLK